MNTSKLEVPLLAILKYFLNMTCFKKEYANISAVNKGKMPALKIVKEDDEDSFLSSNISENSSPKKGKVEGGKNYSDERRFMKCQLQLFTILDA